MQSPIDRAEILEAVSAIALEAREQIYWVQQLPGTVVNLPAPSMDEIESEYDVSKCGDEQLHRERIVAEAIARGAR
jgi:hypothetical protein